MQFAMQQPVGKPLNSLRSTPSIILQQRAQTQATGIHCLHCTEQVNTQQIRVCNLVSLMTP